MPLRHLAFALPLLALACGPQSSPVTVGGHLLDPEDGVFWSGQFSGLPSTRLVIADTDDLRERFEDADACSQSANDGTPGDGVFLTLSVNGQESGEYAIAGADPARSAEVRFVVRSGGSVVFSDRAVSGVVSFAALEPGARAHGRYALRMQAGDVIEGDFAGSTSKAFDALIQRIAEARLSCSTTYSPTACSARCICSSRAANTADCTRADSASDWACACLRNGERTRCNVPRTEGNVCTQGNGCCDTRF